MRCEVIDFPSDPNCELVKGLREKLCAALHRGSESKDAYLKLREVLVFTAGKLKDCEEELQSSGKLPKPEQSTEVD